MTQKDKVLAFHFWLLGFVTLAGVILLLSQPASPQNQVVFSFSLPQILFSLGWVIMAAACFYMGFTISKPANRLGPQIFEWIGQPKYFRILILIAIQLLVLVSVALFFNTPEIFGKFTGYLVRLRPFLWWMVLASLHLISLLTILNYKGRKGTDNKFLNNQKRYFLVFLSLFCFLWIVISLTGFGVGTNNDPVRTPTVYILFSEILIAILMTCQLWLFSQYGRLVFDKEQQRNLALVSPLLLSLVIWSAAVLVWIDEPMRGSYYRIGPFPPTGDYIPASDPTRFDLPGQLALIGEGLNGGKYIDNPFYVFMVMLFRIAGGQFYDRMITFQIAVLAVIPVSLFLIGRMFSGNYLGILLAVLTIIREKNIIKYASDTWLSPVKALLTEPFITLLLILFSLFLIKWLKDKGSSPENLILAGGIFGLSTLVRTNPWFLLPVTVGVILLQTRFRLRKAIYSSTIFGAAVFLSILPWMFRSQATIDTPFYFLFKMQHSVVEERYQKTSPKENKMVPPKEPSIFLGLSRDSVQPGLENITNAAGSHPQPIQTIPFLSEAIPSASPGDFQKAKGNDQNQPAQPLIRLISEHFMFNFVNTIQILPTLLPNSTPGTPVMFPTSVFTQTSEAGPWRLLSGNLSLFFILVCLSAGISFNKQMPFLAGIFPLIYFLTYSAGTAVALTSASRYTQPIEWVILLYFSAGLFYLVGRITFPVLDVIEEPGSTQIEHSSEIQSLQEKKTHPIQSLAPLMVVFLVVGALIPLSDFIFPQKYAVQAKEEIIKRMVVQRLADSSGMNPEAYLDYLYRPDTEIIEGRLVYAQYYRAGEGEDMSRMREVVYDFPRITFELLGPYKPVMNVLLPHEEPWPDEYLNGQTAIVIGCMSREGMDAMTVFLPDLDLYISRTSEIPQTCR